MFSVILLTSIAALLLWIFCQFMGVWFLQRRPPPGSKLPPMPPASSMLGHVEVLRRDFHRKKCLEWAKEYGPIIRLKIYLQDVVVLNDYNTIKKFWNTKELLWRWPTFVGYSDVYRGLGQLNGEAWSANRKFCMSMLRDLGFAKTAMEGRMMREFRRIADGLGDTKGKPVDLTQYVTPCAFNNAVSFFYGEQLTHDNSTTRKLHGLMGRMGRTLFHGQAQMLIPWKLRRVLSWLPFTTSHRIADLLAQLYDVSAKQIELYKTSKPEDDTRDFIHRYSNKIGESRDEQMPLFTDDYLVGNVNTFLMAGTFSTTNTMTWHMLNFAKNPDTIQARVQREIDDVVGEERQPTWEDRKMMPYTLACVWEMDRWKTAAPLGVARECAGDVVVGDIFIPKGTILLPNIWAAHNDLALWEEPEKFIPERYLKEDGKLVSHKPEHLIPFSVGRRDCPGQTFAAMEIFLLVTFLLQKYHILPEHAIDFDLDCPEIDLPDARNVKLRFIPRKSGKY